MQLIPIQITLQAANAADARQLVHDLAGTMGSNPTDIPANTTVSTLPAPAQPPAQPAYPLATPLPSNVMPFPIPPPAPTYAAQQPPVQQQPAYPQPPVQQQLPVPDPAPAVPVAAQTFSQDQLAVAATSLMDAGRMLDVQNLLAQFGVQALTQLPKEHYGNFATHLRALGARI